MTAPQPHTHTHVVIDLASSDQRRPQQPVAFSDGESLQQRLDRRTADRRRPQLDEGPRPAGAAQLGTRELCHDLRQPLASAVLLTHMVEREQGLSAAGRSQVELLRAELVRLAGMLTSHLEPAAPVLVDVADLVRDVCRAPAEPGVAPVELVLEGTPLVRGEPVLLGRLVANLVTNAREAAGRTGRVRVRVGAAEGSARIAVEDSGDAVGTAPTSGFGLGLLIVDSVVARHGGGSTCSASELGGLQITVSLPAVPASAAGGRP